jgi:hypothetical protein
VFLLVTIREWFEIPTASREIEETIILFGPPSPHFFIPDGVREGRGRGPRGRCGWYIKRRE